MLDGGEDDDTGVCLEGMCLEVMVAKSCIIGLEQDVSCIITYKMYHKIYLSI